MVVYPILDYISRTTSLKRLICDVSALDDDDDLPDDADEISKAIFANQSITELEMRPLPGHES